MEYPLETIDLTDALAFRPIDLTGYDVTSDHIDLSIMEDYASLPPMMGDFSSPPSPPVESHRSRRGILSHGYAVVLPKPKRKPRKRAPAAKKAPVKKSKKGPTKRRRKGSEPLPVPSTDSSSPTSFPPESTFLESFYTATQDPTEVDAIIQSEAKVVSRKRQVTRTTMGELGLQDRPTPCPRGCEFDDSASNRRIHAYIVRYKPPLPTDPKLADEVDDEEENKENVRTSRGPIDLPIAEDRNLSWFQFESVDACSSCCTFVGNDWFVRGEGDLERYRDAVAMKHQRPCLKCEQMVELNSVGAHVNGNLMDKYFSVKSKWWCDVCLVSVRCDTRKCMNVIHTSENTCAPCIAMGRAKRDVVDCACSANCTTCQANKAPSSSLYMQVTIPRCLEHVSKLAILCFKRQKAWSSYWPFVGTHQSSVQRAREMLAASLSTDKENVPKQQSYKKKLNEILTADGEFLVNRKLYPDSDWGSHPTTYEDPYGKHTVTLSSWIMNRDIQSFRSCYARYVESFLPNHRTRCPQSMFSKVAMIERWESVNLTSLAINRLKAQPAGETRRKWVAASIIQREEVKDAVFCISCVNLCSHCGQPIVPTMESFECTQMNCNQVFCEHCAVVFIDVRGSAMSCIWCVDDITKMSVIAVLNHWIRYPPLEWMRKCDPTLLERIVRRIVK